MDMDHYLTDGTNGTTGHPYRVVSLSVPSRCLDNVRKCPVISQCPIRRSERE